MTEDHKLIKCIKAGDKKAFDCLVRKYYKNIFAYCYRRTGDKEIAADLTQDVFTKLIAAIYNYSRTGKFVNYLFTIAVNTCTDYLRKKKLYVTEIDGELVEAVQSPPDEDFIQEEENETLYGHLLSLPDIQKNALILHYYHGLKIKDISVITGVPVSTVKSRMKQGIDKLRKIYQKEGEYF
ncbi:MAG TPA: RNA polymerase sigma factor [Candidatus Scybalocola faecigallinarum]|uniref:RNA polymerase sigma factor n=1 Tax=Candidatus Scybalocola faecigallinarum TaxID=2840941 RepID=A0A9D1F425_9FIRM|nr:RNA polymerase sigma factor [Candidatus Scybalocola faecigallinarum]